jgi:hypothetical protein
MLDALNDLLIPLLHLQCQLNSGRSKVSSTSHAPSSCGSVTVSQRLCHSTLRAAADPKQTYHPDALPHGQKAMFNWAGTPLFSTS